jgi:hypothetical protein
LIFLISVTESDFIALLEVIDRPTCLRASACQPEEFEMFIAHIYSITEKASEL